MFEFSQYVKMLINLGFESHIVLKDSRKLYCYCKPDKNSCPICCGEPGALPCKVSSTSLKNGLKLGKVLKGLISKKFIVFRKHYRYYDLPNGYQRTQHPSYPLFSQGKLFLPRSGKVLSCKGYLEEDPAALKGKVVDMRRSGSPLLQLVIDKITLEKEQIPLFVKQYFRTLKRIVLDLKIVGSRKIFKTDVNVSLPHSPRYEIKNVTSLKDILKAIERSVILQKEDMSAQDKTYHYKNGLIFSRLKETYPFLRQWNLCPLRLIGEVSVPKTLYLYYLKKQQSNPHPLNYAFLKQLFSLYDQRTINQNQLDSLCEIDPVEGLKLIELKLKDSQKLRQQINKWVCQITEQDFRSKNAQFLKALKQLKSELHQKQIKFSSYCINKILQDIFGLDPTRTHI